MFVTLRRFNLTLLEKLTTLELPLQGMPDGTQKFEYELGMDFFRKWESTDVLGGAVNATVEVKRSGDIYELYIVVKGEIGIPCDRCLYEMRHPVDADYRVSVKYGEEYSDESDNVIVIPESSNTMDVSGLVYDTIMLTIPLKHVHPDGECDAEMREQLNAHRATLADDDNGSYDDDAADDGEMNDFGCDPRWEALKKLKDNN